MSHTAVKRSRAHRVVSIWHDIAGITDTPAAATTDDPASPAIVTIHIVSIIERLDTSELQKSAKKALRFSGHDDAVKPLDCLKVIQGYFLPNRLGCRNVIVNAMMCRVDWPSSFKL